MLGVDFCCPDAGDGKTVKTYLRRVATKFRRQNLTSTKNFLIFECLCPDLVVPLLSLPLLVPLLVPSLLILFGCTCLLDNSKDSFEWVLWRREYLDSGKFST